MPFNNTILECKLKLCLKTVIPVGLLIAPYWNVNNGTKISASVVKPSFNNTIVECKFSGFLFIDFFSFIKYSI